MKNQPKKLNENKQNKDTHENIRKKNQYLKNQYLELQKKSEALVLLLNSVELKLNQAKQEKTKLKSLNNQLKRDNEDQKKIFNNIEQNYNRLLDKDKKQINQLEQEKDLLNIANQAKKRLDHARYVALKNESEGLIVKNKQLMNKMKNQNKRLSLLQKEVQKLSKKSVLEHEQNERLRDSLKSKESGVKPYKNFSNKNKNVIDELKQRFKSEHSKNKQEIKVGQEAKEVKSKALSSAGNAKSKGFAQINRHNNQKNVIKPKVKSENKLLAKPVMPKSAMISSLDSSLSKDMVRQKANASIMAEIRELRELQMDIIVGALIQNNKLTVPIKPEEFHNFINSKDRKNNEIGRLLESVENVDIIGLLSDVERQTYEDIHKKYSYDDVKWENGKPTNIAENYELTDKASGSNNQYKLGDEEIKNYRNLDIPVKSQKGAMHVSFALRDLQGKNISKKNAAYLTVHYDKEGNLIEMTAPLPVYYTGKNNDSPLCVKRKNGKNGKLYTLPINKGQYHNMMKVIENNKERNKKLKKAMDKNLSVKKNSLMHQVQKISSKVSDSVDMDNMVNKDQKNKFAGKVKRNSKNSRNNGPRL